MLFKTVAYRWLKYQEKLVKHSTFALYQYTVEKYILPYFKQTSLEKLSNEVFQNYIFYLHDQLHLSNKSIQNIEINLKQIMHFAFEHNYCKYFIIKLRLPKENVIKNVSTFNEAEINNLKSYLFKNINSINIGILLSIYCGLRIGEVCGITWKDIDLDNNILFVNKTVQRIYFVHNNIKKSSVEITTPKSKKSIRKIPLHKDLLKLLKENQKQENIFLLSNSINPMEPRVYRNFYKKILLKNNITFKKYHALRHTFATKLITNGADPKVVSEILGHTKVITTLDLYVHPDIDNMRSSINNI